jgi:uncharacterized protein
MMKAPIESLAGQVAARPDFDSPPLHLWNPALSGDIPIRINSQGTWYHDGSKIERESLVQLFANILRREDDGEYYLVTPTEKWRVVVESHPLLVTDIDVLEEAGVRVLEATLNTGRRIVVSELHPLFLDAAEANIAVLRLSYGLTAICTRPAWYRLVDLTELRDGNLTLRSGAFEVRLATT